MSRERDPSDGRRVIIRLARDKGEKKAIGSLFTSLEKAWNDIASDYNDEQIAFLVEFLKRSNAAVQEGNCPVTRGAIGRGRDFTPLPLEI